MNQKKQLNQLAHMLIDLADEGGRTKEFVFLINKFNTVTVKGKKYYLKLQEAEEG